MGARNAGMKCETRQLLTSAHTKLRDRSTLSVLRGQRPCTHCTHVCPHDRAPHAGRAEKHGEPETRPASVTPCSVRAVHTHKPACVQRPSPPCGTASTAAGRQAATAAAAALGTVASLLLEQAGAATTHQAHFGLEDLLALFDTHTCSSACTTRL